MGQHAARSTAQRASLLHRAARGASSCERPPPPARGARGQGRAGRPGGRELWVRSSLRAAGRGGGGLAPGAPRPAPARTFHAPSSDLASAGLVSKARSARPRSSASSACTRGYSFCLVYGKSAKAHTSQDFEQQLPSPSPLPPSLRGPLRGLRLRAQHTPVVPCLLLSPVLLHFPPCVEITSSKARGGASAALVLYPRCPRTAPALPMLLPARPRWAPAAAHLDEQRRGGHAWQLQEELAGLQGHQEWHHTAMPPLCHQYVLVG